MPPCPYSGGAFQRFSQKVDFWRFLAYFFPVFMRDFCLRFDAFRAKALRGSSPLTQRAGTSIKMIDFLGFYR